MHDKTQASAKHTVHCASSIRREHIVPFARKIFFHRIASFTSQSTTIPRTSCPPPAPTTGLQTLHRRYPPQYKMHNHRHNNPQTTQQIPHNGDRNVKDRKTSPNPKPPNSGNPSATPRAALSTKCPAAPTTAQAASRATPPGVTLSPSVSLTILSAQASIRRGLRGMRCLWGY